MGKVGTLWRYGASAEKDKALVRFLLSFESVTLS
jgi:hypothetical protein